MMMIIIIIIIIINSYSNFRNCGYHEVTEWKIYTSLGVHFANRY
jgi:hypothetical protein